MTQLTEKQFQKIESLLPKVRGSKRISQIDFINAILYVIENGCKWRRLPKEFGPWHTVYMRMRRWAESGVLLRVFRTLREEFLIDVDVSSLSLDSTFFSSPLLPAGELLTQPSASVGRGQR